MNTEDFAKLQIMEEELPNAIAQHFIIAKFRLGQFNNYIEAGFTEAQALYLIKQNKEEE